MSTFEGLGLQENLLKAITALGYTQPTPIQEKAIPVLLSGTKDLVGLAQTGTGKTAAFGLPLLQLLKAEQRFPQALIVCPTRELCMQIVSELELFKKFMAWCSGFGCIWWCLHRYADPGFKKGCSNCRCNAWQTHRPDRKEGHKS